MPRVRRCRYPGCHAMVKLPDHYCADHYQHEVEYRVKRARWHHDQAHTRRYNLVTRNRNQTKHDQYQFYRSKQWQDLRRQALDRDHYVCRYCGRPDSNTVDHTIPIEVAPDRMADLDNLATICRSCHYRKTLWERKRYGTGDGNQLTGAPVIGDVEQIRMLLNGPERPPAAF